MEFDVQKVGCRDYKELTVKEGNANIASGLLNNNEALSIGSEMFDALQELLGEAAFKILIKEHFTKKICLETVMSKTLEETIDEIKEHINTYINSSDVSVICTKDFYDELVLHPIMLTHYNNLKRSVLNKSQMKKVTNMRKVKR